MIPGLGKAIKDIDIDNDAFKGIEAIIQSMTPKERQNPEIINASRRQRIAKGSGTSMQDVNRLLKQFDPDAQDDAYGHYDEEPDEDDEADAKPPRGRF